MDDREVVNLMLDDDFVDRFSNDSSNAIDVIIPLLNSNPLFEKCIQNFYKVIPINRLLIGDGGTNDGSLEIVRKYPRVTVLDHTSYQSQGASIKDLIDNCQTEYFVYLHADVLLPKDWFDIMYSKRKESPWFESDRRMMTVLVWDPKHLERKRAYSGSQFGETEVLQDAISSVDDDYLQRNEDIIIAELVGIDKYKKYKDTYHYHQIMSKRGDKEPPIELIFTPPKVKRDPDLDWEIKIYNMQWKGLIKYCSPKPYLMDAVVSSINRLREINELTYEEVYDFISQNNREWEDEITKYHSKSSKGFYKKVLGKLKYFLSKFLL